MKSVLMMSTANIKKRLSQSFLIGLTVLMASLLLATAIGILGNTQGSFEQMFEEQNSSQVTMLLEKQVQDADNIALWWQSKEGVKGVSKIPYYTVGGEISHNGKLQSMGDLMLSEHPGKLLTQDKLVIVEGEIKNEPGPNELWVPTGYAYSWGINTGDTLEVSLDGLKKKMKVSAIVVDPQFSAGLTNPVRVWVSPDFLAENVLGADGLSTMIAVRFNDYSQYEELWPEFEEYLGTPFFGFLYEYESIRNAYSMIQSILGVILLIFSVIIILVSVFVIAFTISNAVITDYKIIGILKAQGFSAGDVKRIYSIQYLFLATIFIPAGIIFSKPAVGAIMSQMTKSLGIAQLNTSLLLPAVLTSAVMLSLVFAASFISAAKAGGIKPAEAIRNSAPAKNVSRRRFDITIFSALPVSLLLALKNVLTGKRHALFMVAAAAIMAFVLVFSVNTYNSVRNMDQNYAYWGFDDADVLISRDAGIQGATHKEILEPLYADDRVEAAIPQSVILNTAIPAQAGQTSKNVVGFMYGGDMDAIGVLNLQGKNPVHDNEVSISYLVAQKYNKNVGDMIDLFLEGEKNSYLVTGIYQSMNAMGWGFRIQESAVQKVNPAFSAGNYPVKLKDGNDLDAFVSDMKRVFGEGYTIRTVYESGEINISGITANMAVVTILLSVIFMVVAFVITFNATLMSIYSDKKSFGIYKALGMTPVQIRMSMVWKVFLLALIGIILGGPLALMLSPYVLGMLLSNMGMVKFPFDVTVSGTAIALPLCLAVAILSAWIPSGKILGISPRNLIVD